MKRNDTPVLVKFAVIVIVCVFAYGIYFSLVRTVSDTRSNSQPTSLRERIQYAIDTILTDEQFDMSETTRKAGTHLKTVTNNAHSAMNRYTSYLRNRPGGFLGRISDFFFGDFYRQQQCYQSQRLNRATRIYERVSGNDRVLQDSKNSYNIGVWSKVIVIILAILVFIILIRNNVKIPQTQQSEQVPEPQPVQAEPVPAQAVQEMAEPPTDSKGGKMFEEKESGAQLENICSKYDLNYDEMLELYGNEKKALSTLRIYDVKCMNDCTKMDVYLEEDRSRKIVTDITAKYDLHINAKSVYGSYVEAAENLQQYEQECGLDKQKMFDIVNRDLSYQRAVRNLCDKYNLEVAYVLRVYGDIEDTYGHLQSYAKLYGRDKKQFIARVQSDADGNVQPIAEPESESDDEEVEAQSGEE